MSEAVNLIVPLFAFMLIPVWIPLIAVVVGWLRDLARPRTEHPVLATLRARRAESAPARPVRSAG